MLLNLHVKNLAIIDEVEVYFKDRLNIITGETGAGKSIIIGSINIALGGKVSKDMIRKGADYALVELAFHIEDEETIEAIRNYEVPIEDGQVIVTRKIMNGKSICKVNGENVTMTMLKDIASLLLDIHGQHEHQSLLYKKNHLEILDHYGKEAIADKKELLLKAYKDYARISKLLEESILDEEKRIREISFLEYEVNEIEAARIKLDEDKELELQYKKLSNASLIKESLSHVYQVTGDGERDSMYDGISQASRLLSKIKDYDKEVEDFFNQLTDMEDLVNSFNRELMNYLENMSLDEEEYQRAEGRLNQLNHLKAKYGDTIEKIQEYYEESLDKLNKYRDYDNYLDKIRKELASSKKKLDKLSSEISYIRKEKAKELTRTIEKALIDLNFLDVKFDMDFKRLDHYTSRGYDDAEFIISTNPGEDLKPLGKVSSGGELSRIMLSIKSVLADTDAIDTLIFDEIDVGVSGRTAQKVSEKLSVISKNHQVICITHLPQIAAMADGHYIIEKLSDNISTKTSITSLTEEGSIHELARMLGGAKITDTVIQNAREMKELAEHTKIY